MSIRFIWLYKPGDTHVVVRMLVSRPPMALAFKVEVPAKSPTLGFALVVTSASVSVKSERLVVITGR